MLEGLILLVSNVVTCCATFYLNKDKNKAEVYDMKLDSIEKTLKIYEKLQINNADIINSYKQQSDLQLEEYKRTTDKRILKLTEQQKEIFKAFTNTIAELGCKDSKCNNKKRFTREEAKKIIGDLHIISD